MRVNQLLTEGDVDPTSEHEYTHNQINILMKPANLTVVNNVKNASQSIVYSL